jgi:DNA-binding LytR/AlgR family response regulator
MIRVLIIEDERTSLENLLYHLKLTKEPLTVVGTLESIEDALNWFADHETPDLIFLDIQLKDGISFSIFEQMKIATPIIFTTAFDNYMIRAFEQTGIDYLLKPIGEKELYNALQKYKKLKSHFIDNYEKLTSYLTTRENKKRSRIIVKRGVEYQSIPLDIAAYFVSKNKISFLVTNENTKYLLDKTLKELEDELDAKTFYRANRKFIININYIKSYKVYDKVKLLVELTVPVSEEIIISQETASDFKAWISNI